MSFREKVEPKVVEQKTTEPVESETSGEQVVVDDLLATYEDAVGHPYIAEYLDLKSVWKEDKSLQTDLHTIEKHLKDKVSNDELANSTKAAKKYIRELEKKADIDPIMDSENTRIRKLLAYIEFLDVIK